MRPEFQERSELKHVGRIIPEAQRRGFLENLKKRKYKSNYPIPIYWDWDGI